MTRRTITLIALLLAFATSAAAVTFIAVQWIRGDTASTSGSILVTNPNTSTAAWAKVGANLSITSGVLNATTPPNFSDEEVPAGTPNGTLASFTLAHTPNPSTSLKVYHNGLRMQQGTSADYTLSGNTITFLAGAIPETGAVLVADYRF